MEINSHQLNDLHDRVERIVKEFCGNYVAWSESGLMWFPQSWIRVGKDVLLDCFRLALVFEVDSARREALRTSMITISDFFPALTKPISRAEALPNFPDRITDEFISKWDATVELGKESVQESLRLLDAIREVEANRENSTFVRQVISRGLELMKAGAI